MDKKNMSLRDLYAEQRTLLAIERTMLAYVRTTLSLVVAGLGSIKFIENHSTYKYIGTSLISIGIIVLFYGIYKIIKAKNNMRKFEKTKK